jgi:autoinducer 2-degrading protein
MFTVMVSMDAQPGHAEELAGLLATNARLSVENEPGCHVFDVNRPPAAPDRFLLYEVYEDEEAFLIGHKGSSHFAEFITSAASLLVPGSKQETFAIRTVAGSKLP